MSGRGRNPSRPNNSGFKVIPAHAPRSAYLGKAKKLKESLIERAKIKKSFAKTLKKEGLSSDRLVRGADGTIIGGQRGAERGGMGSAGGARGKGRGRGGSSAMGAAGSGRGRGGRSGPSNDGARELARQTVGTSKSNSSTAKPKQPLPESESDESELESGEERAPRATRKHTSHPTDLDDGADSDDGFFDDDPNGENTIDSGLSLNKGKGRAKVGGEDDDEEMRPRESRERSRAGPAPGSDMDDDDDDDDNNTSNYSSARLPYTRPSTTRGTARGGSSSATRGRPSVRGNPGVSFASSTVHNPGTARPWGTNPEAGTTTRPKGKKDASNPNFTFLGAGGDDAVADQAQGSRSNAGGRRERPGTTLPASSLTMPKPPPPSDMPFRGKPLHSHKIVIPDDSTTAASSTLRDIKRSAYLGSGPGLDVHPGRTKRVMANAGKQVDVGSNSSTTAVAHGSKPKHDTSASTSTPSKPFNRGRPDPSQKPKSNKPYPKSNANGSYRNSSTNTGSRQPRLGARMGALLQEIERRGV